MKNGGNIHKTEGGVVETQDKKKDDGWTKWVSKCNIP